MPLYQYRCESCGTESEVLVRNGEAVACPACESDQVTRLYGVFAAVAGPSRDAAPVGCGAPSCCRLEGGGCMN